MTEHIYESAIRELIARQSADSKKQLQQFSAELFETISQGLLHDGYVRIHQFGSFKLNWAKERRGRHPKTGETLLIPAQPRISFTPAKALKDQINETATTIKPAAAVVQVESKKIIDTAAPSPASPVITPPTQAQATVNQASEPGKNPDESTINPNSDEPSRSWVLNHKTALAASIIVALLAMTLFQPIKDNESQPDEVKKYYNDHSSPLVVINSDNSNQAGSHKLIKLEQVSKSDALMDIQQLRSAEIIQIDSSLIEADTSITEHKPQHDPEHYFRERPHKLADGDSLWRLSRKHYINPFYWPHIYQANQTTIDNPNTLITGSIIQLPVLIGSPDKLSAEDRRNIAEGYFLVYQHHKKTNKSFPYYALLGVNKFDPEVIQEHIYEIDEQDWHSFQLASN